MSKKPPHESDDLQKYKAFQRLLDENANLRARLFAYPQMLWTYKQALRVCSLLGYKRSDLMIMSEEFLQYLHDNPGWDKTANLIALFSAYEALESTNAITAIQLGTEQEKVDINALNEYYEKESGKNASM